MQVSRCRFLPQIRNCDLVHFVEREVVHVLRVLSAYMPRLWWIWFFLCQRLCALRDQGGLSVHGRFQDLRLSNEMRISCTVEIVVLGKNAADYEGVGTPWQLL